MSRELMVRQNLVLYALISGYGFGTFTACASALVYDAGRGPLVFLGLLGAVAMVGGIWLNEREKSTRPEDSGEERK